MGTLLLYGLIALVAVCLLFGLGVLVLPKGEQVAPPAPDVRPWALAEGPLRAQDVLDVRLPVAVRGYRFAETDQLLDRLAEELRNRDAEIARLRGEPLPGEPLPGEPLTATGQPITYPAANSD